LTEIQNLLSDNSNNDPAFKESMLVAASNRFFTLIPSTHPHIIRDEFDFKAKVCYVQFYTSMFLLFGIGAEPYSLVHVISCFF
jgi:hypothetical protein